jgi:MFS family permease
MQSITAVGSLIGSILIASSTSKRFFNEKMLLGLVGFGAGLAVFVIMPNVWVALIPLFIAGLCMQTYQVSNNTLLQMNVDPEYRGRVLSTLFLQRGMVPLGTMLAGILTTYVGPRVAMGGMAVSLLIIGALAFPLCLPVLKSLTTDGALHLGRGGRSRASSAARTETEPATVGAAGG